MQTTSSYPHSYYGLRQVQACVVPTRPPFFPPSFSSSRHFHRVSLYNSSWSGSQRLSTCLCLPVIGIKGVYHDACVVLVFETGSPAAQIGLELVIFLPSAPKLCLRLLAGATVLGWFCTLGMCPGCLRQTVLACQAKMYLTQIPKQERH